MATAGRSQMTSAGNSILTGWGAGFLLRVIATSAASAVHRVCVTTCFIIYIGILYEVNKLFAKVHQKAEVKKKAF
ncbi:hypothetical protein L7F22_026910 [Adiantum nelumboides]|nr:hypothetical protein [Adiantum nelumboides]